MNRLLLKATTVVALISIALWPLAALAHEGPGAVPMTGSPTPLAVLLAYIDPGAGGFIIVTVLGFISAMGYMARSYLARLKGMLFKTSTASREGRDGKEG